MTSQLNLFNPEESIESILVTPEQIAERIAELGKEITRDFDGRDILVISVLKGSVIFLADMVRQIKIPAELDFVTISTYLGEAKAVKDPEIEELLPIVKNRNVLVVEDILDTGKTLNKTVQTLWAMGSREVRTCVLLAKEGYKGCFFPSPDYIGFCIPDVFVIGYGLDYKERFRNLPYVAILRREIYEAEEER